MSSPLKSTTGLTDTCQMSCPPCPPGRAESKNSVEPSADMYAHSSKAEPLIIGPRLTGSPQGSERVARLTIYRSALPYPPVRCESKRITRPSAEMHKRASWRGLLTVGPRFTGSVHGSSLEARLTHRSAPLEPPGRAEVYCHLLSETRADKLESCRWTSLNMPEQIRLPLYG